MARRIAQVVSIVFVVAATAGCRASAPARFYTLASTASTDGAPAANYAVTVGPVTVPASVDRPQFVVQVAPNRVALDEFNRWVAPLDESIARAVALSSATTWRGLRGSSGKDSAFLSGSSPSARA